VDLSSLEIGFLLRFNVLGTVSYVLSGGKSISYDPAKHGLRVELGGAELNLRLSRREGRRGIVYFNHCLLHAHYIAMQRGFRDC
jgi:hypothetical protein